MFRTRHLQISARLALAWLLLALGVSVAAPVFKPVPMTLVCSATGAMKWVAQTPDRAPDQPTDASPAAGAHTLDCALCLGWTAPPAAVPLLGAHLPTRVALPPSLHSPWVARRTAAPQPPRGPPTFS